jgi:hypothetical protein
VAVLGSQLNRRAAIAAAPSPQAALDPAVQHHAVAAVAGTAMDGRASDSDLPDGLTPREAKVLALRAEG